MSLAALAVFALVVFVSVRFALLLTKALFCSPAPNCNPGGVYLHLIVGVLLLALLLVVALCLLVLSLLFVVTL